MTRCKGICGQAVDFTCKRYAAIALSCPIGCENVGELQYYVCHRPQAELRRNGG